MLVGAHAVAAEPRVIVNGGSADEVEIHGDDSVVHRASGFVFANHIGDMPLRKIQVYGTADASVDYSLRGGGNGDAWITVFVYPAQKQLADEATDIENALIETLHGSRTPSIGELPSTAADGRSGWYKGILDHRKMTSGYIVVRRGDWFVEARATVPDEAGPLGIERTRRALAAIPWHWRPPASPAPATT